MAQPEMIAVRAATKDMRALVHQPSGEAFDESGKGLWPADQFTFRLLQEGAIKRLPDAADTDQPAASPASKEK